MMQSPDEHSGGRRGWQFAQLYEGRDDDMNDLIVCGVHKVF